MMEIGYAIGGRYRIIQEIGSGELSIVYLARDLILDRDVAVKVLRYQLTEGSTVSKLFEQSAVSITELNDPHLISIYDVGNDNGNQYLVMESVRGNNLQDYLLQNFPLQIEQVQKIVLQMTLAVNKAHSLGFIHGDLKPQNILIDNKSIVKLSDFGLMDALKQIGIIPVNASSLFYRAPEQLDGAIATKQSDLYAIGVILFEMLNGSLPFDGGMPIAAIVEKLSLIREFQPQVSKSFENIITRSTALNPKDRYASAEEMAQDIQTALDTSRINEAKLYVGSHDVASIDDEGHLTSAKDQNKKKKHLSKQKKILVFAGTICTMLLITLLLVVLLNRKKDVEIPDLANIDQDSAVSELQSEKLKISPKIEKISDDHISVGKVIKTDPPAHTKVKEGSAVRLFVSSGHQTFNIGDYVSKTFVDAKDELERKGLKVKSTRKYSDTVKEGLIIEQNVNPGTKVSKGSTVVITVSKGVEPITMPNFVGVSLNDALDFAAKNNLNLVEDIPQFSDSFPSRTIIKQSPDFGIKLKKGDDFHVTYSKGSKPRVNLPNDDPGLMLVNLIGENRTNVNIYAKNHGLKIVEETAQYSDEYEEGTVINQYPESGIKVKSGDSIRVTYSLGPQPQSQSSDNKSKSSNFSTSSSDVVK